MKRLHLILVVLIVAFAGLAAAQEAAEKKSIEQQKADLVSQAKYLKDKVKEPLQRHYWKIRSRLQKSPEIRKLLEQRRQLEEKLEKTRETDPEILESAADLEQARKQYEWLVTTAAAANPKTPQLQKQLETDSQRLKQLKESYEQARRKVYSEWRRVDQSDELEAYRDKLQAAQKAHRELPHTSETFIAARREQQEAKQAWREKTKTLEEHQAVQAARKALEAAEAALETRSKQIPEYEVYIASVKSYQDLKENSPELEEAAALIKQRREEYAEARKTLRAEDPGAAEAMAAFKKLESDIHALNKSINETQAELRNIRRESVSQNPKIAETREAVGEAKRKHYKVVQEQTQEDKAAIEISQEEYKKALDAAIRDDPEGSKIARKLDEVEKQLQELREKYRKLNKRK